MHLHILLVYDNNGFVPRAIRCEGTGRIVWNPIGGRRALVGRLFGQPYMLR